jgi:hypothetical protein
MSKKLLLTSASVIIFSTASYANPHCAPKLDDMSVVIQDAPIMHKMLETQSLPEISEISEGSFDNKLPADLIGDFAKFSYSVDKTEGWKNEDKAIYNKLINDGWKLDTFKGTTGTATAQVESVSGLLAFKGDHVVIATRGTEMANFNDWMTNVRFSRSPIMRFFADEANKLSAITAQFFGGVTGEVANGFLQTHLSSWDYIKEAIIKYAASQGKSTQDLHYTITGHSKGAAKAQLNAVNLLTDSTLGVGVDYLERSFIFSSPEMEDLGMSGFYGIPVKSEPKNKGNVFAVVYESPRVFSNEAAEHVNNILGTENLVRVENEGVYDFDPVTKVGPEFLGFNHAGTKIGVNGKGAFVGRHGLGNVKDAAVPHIEAHIGSMANKKVEMPKVEVEPNVSVPSAPATEAAQPEETKTYFGKSVVDTFANVGSAIRDGASSAYSNVTSAISNAWSYFWG